MSDTKKYYYLRLKDNFFQSPNVRYLETMKNGCEYIVLLLSCSCYPSTKTADLQSEIDRIPLCS